MPLARVGVAADGIVLVSQPHNEDDVESRGGVIEELGHDRLHAYREREGENVTRLPLAITPSKISLVGAQRQEGLLQPRGVCPAKQKLCFCRCTERTGRCNFRLPEGV